MNKNQRGFAILEGFLILIIIVVVAGVGWYTIHTKHQTDKILSQADKISQNTPVSSTKMNSAGSNQTTTSYLVVKEWGVRFKTSSVTNDAEYLIKDEHTLYLTTKRYTALAATCGLNGRTGYIARGVAGYSILAGRPIQSDTFEGKLLAVKIGDYYYEWVGPQAPCTNPDNKSAQTYQAAIVDMAKSVQAVPAQ